MLWFAAVAMQAARVDTVLVKSPSMDKEVQVVYVLPEKALGKKAQSCPVIYLLHGYSGNAKSWIGIKPDLPLIADEKGLFLFVPMVRTVGTGIARRTRIIVTRRLSLRSW
nr:CAZy families CE1 protein [uncultured Bacteroides sp.]